MRSLAALKKYFLTGTTEGDRAFLSKAFINHEQLSSLLSIEEGGMRIMVGNKGTGKTAILEWIATIAKRRKLPVLLVRPDNLKTKLLPTTGDIGALKGHFYDALVSAVATEVGSKLKGLLTGDKATLFNAAKKAGRTSPDFVEKTLELLTALSVPVSKVNGIQLAKDLAGDQNSDSLIAAINGNLLESGTVFFLLIDDTDQVATPTDSNQLNRIWALLLAVRRLVGECTALRCIVSLRSEIWTRLTNEERGQRDQTDHLRDLTISLRASDELMEKILERRMALAVADSTQKNPDLYANFFDGQNVILPTSEEVRKWQSFLLKSARERPRDVIQLVRKLIDRADKNKLQKIDNKCAEEGMKEFSKERVGDLAIEFSEDCGELKKVVDLFSKIKFEVPYDEILSHLKTAGSEISLNIRGRTIKPEDDDDAIFLLRFLHETGFVNPRVIDIREPRGFRHVTFDDDPDFVELANLNEMKAATWEVHPAFRSYLLVKKEDAAARFGRIFKKS
ncbi:MAG: hypothetical protein H6R10_1841 [Rhodocyclaceae bacterium]|nr:hypothetical protein [Rhodocyclaceae bacterium]